VTINTVPSAPTMSGPSTACNSASISAAPGSGGNGIRWDNSSTTQGRTVTSTGNYTAVTTSSAGCESGSAGVSVTIDMPGTDGQSSSPCGCESASADCGGLCTAQGTYTVNTEECASDAGLAYVALYDQCNNILDAQYGTYALESCNTNCSDYTDLRGFSYGDECIDACQQNCAAIGLQLHSTWDCCVCKCRCSNCSNVPKLTSGCC
jgi:hypothetical protein